MSNINKITPSRVGKFLIKYNSGNYTEKDFSNRTHSDKSTILNLDENQVNNEYIQEYFKMHQSFKLISIELIFWIS